MTETKQEIKIIAPVTPEMSGVLSDDALAFVGELHRRFDARRREFLEKREHRQAELDAGAKFDFLTETAGIRAGDWKVAEVPADLEKRWVEITGPVTRKMMINALNSGATGFMADFEDSLSPTWENVVNGQQNLIDAVRGTISLQNPDGREYKLNSKTAVLMVRPRGWHLAEKNVLIGGERVSASLFDFGLYFFHNAGELISRGTGPYFYLPKMESHLEARLWADVFVFAEESLNIPLGSIRATVLIETLPAAFEMDEILYELRDYIAALNAGRWDYIFSFIKKKRNQNIEPMPDRSLITMTVPFIRAYTELLVKTCHRRGAHAIGGMAAFIPSRKDAEINATALAQVSADKERETDDGFEGTWVAHPDLVPVAMEVFQRKLGDNAHQKDRRRDDVTAAAADLLDASIPNGKITEAGVRNNINVGLRYLNAWLSGTGAAAIHNLMEDVATAEISRSQLWQWVHRKAETENGTSITQEFLLELLEEEIAAIGGRDYESVADAAELLTQLVLDDDFDEFLTLRAYEKLR